MPDRSPRRRGLGALFAALGAAALAVAACQGGADAPRDTVEPAPVVRAGFSVFATGDMRGYVETCGCAGGLYGGLPRRATYLRGARRPGDVYLDLGNLVSGDSPTQVLVLETSLTVLRSLDCDAFVPGEAEVRLGGRFEEIAARAGPRVVCANVRLRDGGGRVFEASRVLTLPDGRRVAVVGVTEDAVLSERYVVDPPVDGVRAALAELPGTVDAVIVAAAVSVQDARRIAAEFPAVVLVVGGRVPFESPDLVLGGGAPLAFAGRFGEFVARVGVTGDLVAAGAARDWIGERYAVAPDVDEVLRLHRAKVSAANAGLAARLAAELRSAGGAGSETCRPCHAAAYDVWLRSGHSHAVGSLVAKDAARDPSCLPCHLRDVTADPATAPGGPPGGVGCEACHGPSRRHAESAREPGAPAEPPGRTRDATRASCVGCHDPRNSPAFSYDAYAQRVAHDQ